MKLDKPIKSMILNDCAFRISEEKDGLVVEVFPVAYDDDDNVQFIETRGACKSVFDMFGNLVGCKDVGACSKGCNMCVKYDPDTGDILGYFCRCGSCPDKPDIKSA